MALSLYDASIPGYLLMLKNLAALLQKAEAHAKTTGVDPATYLVHSLSWGCSRWLPIRRKSESWKPL